MGLMTAPDLSPYDGIIAYLRAEWQRCPTPTGKPMFGPSWYAVTICDECGNRGFSDINMGKGIRFACITCYGFAKPVAYEGKKKWFPRGNEAFDEYKKWRAKQKLGSDFAMRRNRMKLPI